jgi:hypothetical protein
VRSTVKRGVTKKRTLQGGHRCFPRKKVEIDGTATQGESGDGRGKQKNKRLQGNVNSHVAASKEPQVIVKQWWGNAGDERKPKKMANFSTKYRQSILAGHKNRSAILNAVPAAHKKESRKQIKYIYIRVLCQGLLRKTDQSADTLFTIAKSQGV